MKCEKCRLLGQGSMKVLQVYWQSCCGFFARVFRERELMLRDDGNMHYIRLTRRTQGFAVITVVCIFGWVLGMTALWDIQRTIIDGKNVQIQDAEVAYGDLVDEIVGYQEKVAEVTEKLQSKYAYLSKQLISEDVKKADVNFRGRGNEATMDKFSPTSVTPVLQESLRVHLAQVDIELEQMTATTTLLETSLSKVKAQIARANPDWNKFTSRGDSLQDQIRDLKHQLIDARARAARLDRLKAGLDEKLVSVQVNYTKVSQERGNLERRRRELENDLGAARARGDGLHAEVAKLLKEVDRAQGKIGTVIGHRSALRALVSRLETQLQAAESRIGGLEQDFNNVISRLSKASGNQRGTSSPLQTNMSLWQKADLFLGRLTELHSSQEALLGQLRDRTEGNVLEAEKVIKMTGLDLKKILKRATSHVPDGRGGPITNGDNEKELMDSALAMTVNDVEGHLSRWETLKSVLKSLPLVSPVDYYHLASRFGKRRDPFTKRRAMHYGLDLAGWKKAPVYSTAPGTVVYTGRRGRYGKMVEISHGNGINTRYGHLFKVYVRKGQVIDHRHKIGLLGSTGRSTGPHVHYEVLLNGKQLDPQKFIKAGRHVFKSSKAKSEAKSGKREKTG